MELIDDNYVQTDIGVIPSDWKVVPIRDLIVRFQNGYAFSSIGYRKIGVPIVTMAQIGLDGRFRFDEDEVNYWSENELNKLRDFTLRQGDLIMSMTDVTPQKNLIGRATIIDKEGKYLLNQRVGFLEVDLEKVNPIFLREITNFRHWRLYCISVASLGVQANISTSDINKGKIPLPPTLTEQKAIATALSDVDALIASLDKLIEKKKAIKQGVMQELLTGKRRLEGFGEGVGYKKTEVGEIPEDWEVKEIGEICDVVGGGTPKTGKSDFWGGDINWFTPSEIGAEKFVVESERMITREGLKNSSAKLLPIGTILLTTRASIGECSILKLPSTTNQGFQSLIVQNENDIEFIYYKIQMLRADLLKYSSGSTFLEISPSKVRAIMVAIPKRQEEQLSISEVLSDIDDEIDKLIAKRNKTNDLKQGMMQELLTGKTRLV